MPFSLSPNFAAAGAGAEYIPGYYTCDEGAPFVSRLDTAGEQHRDRQGGKGIRIQKDGTYTFNIAPVASLLGDFPSFGLFDDNKIIEVHKWNQPPNADTNGRVWVADLPREGGEVDVTIDAAFRWVSFYARNDDEGGDYEALYFQWDNSTDISLWTFQDDLNLTLEVNPPV